MDIIEQLDGYHHDERWLLGNGHVLWVIWHYHPPWFAETAALMQRWCGRIHARFAEIHGVRAHERGLLVEVADDRGPTLAEAAAQLAGPERERWVVSQFIELCDALTAMRTRDANAVYAPMNAERFFIDIAGKARLRAPLFGAPAPPTTKTGGADLNLSQYMAPELVVGKPLTPASEVFTLATNMQLAITGHSPFGADDGAMGAMMRIMQGQRAPLTCVTPGLAELLARAFAGDPGARIASPAALADALRICVPDAADYDAVISDRIVTWRAGVPKPEPWGMGGVPRAELEAL